MKTNMKTTRMYRRIAKGVTQESNKSYRVRKMIDGVSKSYYFTNKTQAIKFYKTL